MSLEALERRLAEQLDKQEVADLIVLAHALTDRWQFAEAGPLFTEDAKTEVRIDGVLVAPSKIPASFNLEGKGESANWRERIGVRGHHQWSNVVVIVNNDTATAYLSGTQTNTFPDDSAETSGAMEEAVCHRTPDGWRIAFLGGSYESRHDKLDTYFADQLEGQERGKRPWVRV